MKIKYCIEIKDTKTTPHYFIIAKSEWYMSYSIRLMEKIFALPHWKQRLFRNLN